MFRYVFNTQWYYKGLRNAGVYYGYFKGFEDNIKLKEVRKRGSSRGLRIKN